MAQDTQPTCTGMTGSLPNLCADLVFSYVPMQPSAAEQYSQKQALETGTLFPGLDLPFFKATQKATGCTNTPLCELMALSFAVAELNLYLDTHPEDREALELYRKYIALANEGKMRYEEKYGPISSSNVSGDTYNWIQDPWPWEKQGGMA